MTGNISAKSDYRGKHMLKVFLVEDETLIREGLRDRIPWEQYGFRFVGEAGDGEMALPLIRKTRPDVIITDIKMPFMDGLELSRIVKEEFPKTKILIVSGYDDFEYAREALTIGVDQYILKPVTRMNLRKVLEELKEKIEQEHRQEDYQAKLAGEVHEYEQFSKRRFFENIFGGGMSVTEIYDEAAKQGIDISASSYTLIFLFIQQRNENAPEADINEFVRKQEKVLSYYMKYPQYILFRWEMNCYGVLVKSDADDIRRDTYDAVENTMSECEQAGKYLDWHVVVADPVERLSLLKQCYGQIKQFSAYRFLYPDSFLLNSNTVGKYAPEREDAHIAGIDTSWTSPDIIVDFLKKGSVGEIHDFVESYLYNINEAMNSTMFCNYVILNIRFAVLSYVENSGMDMETYLEKIGRYAQNVHMQKDEVFEYFVHMLHAAISMRDELNSSQSSKKLKRALEYIDEHYMDEDISLGSVACEMKVSANYLSSAFSQSMERTFTEYITEKRMDRAKKLLLETELTSAEIATEVGYKDAHYFSFVFKKTAGISPREYRSRKGA